MKAIVGDIKKNLKVTRINQTEKNKNWEEVFENVNSKLEFRRSGEA